MGAIEDIKASEVSYYLYIIDLVYTTQIRKMSNLGSCGQMDCSDSGLIRSVSYRKISEY